MFKRLCFFLLLPPLIFICCQKNQDAQNKLIVLLPDDILSIQPNLEFETITDSVLFNIYEPLVGFDKDMNLEPMLAHSWQNPQPNEWRFLLRENVYFHDGTPLTAQIAKEILLAIKKDGSLEAAGFLEPVQTITTPDEHTLAIVTREPYAILTKLPFVYLAKQNSDKKKNGLVGTGGYELVERKHGESIKLRAAARYWRDKPEFKEVTFIPIRDGRERLNKLVNGKADIIYAVPADKSNEAPKGIHFVARPGLGVMYLSLNVVNSPDNPLSDIRVRKAIHLALNRKEIVEKALSGSGIVSTQPVAPCVFGYNPQLSNPEYQPEHAKTLLKETQFSKGLRLRLDYNASRETTAVLIQNYLNDIGITVQLNPMQSQALSEIAKSGTSQMLLIGWDCSSGDASEFFEFCMHTPEDYYGDGNYGSYSNKEIDRIARTNMKITDQRERRSMLQKAARIVMEDLPVLPVYVEDDVYGMKEEIHFDPRADREIRLIDVKYVQNKD